MPNYAADIALIDLDGTVADYESAMLRDLRDITSPDEPTITLQVLYCQGRRPDWLENRVDMIRRQPGWWRNLEPIDTGMWVYEQIVKTGFEPYVLTKGPISKPIVASEKLEWCAHFLPEAHPLLVSNQETALQPKHQGCRPSTKGLIYGKVFFDDYPKFMKEWLTFRPRGLGLMLKNELNYKFAHPNVVMFDGDNNKEVERAIQIAYERKPGEELKLS